MLILQILRVLRNSTRPPSYPSSSILPLLARSFSHYTHPIPPSLLRSAPLRAPSPILALCTRRHLSLGSVFGIGPNKPTPSAHAVAHVARIEADADANPADVTKQLVLFQALADTRVSAGWELISARWERMCEFVRGTFLLPRHRSDPPPRVLTGFFRAGTDLAAPQIGQGL